MKRLILTALMLIATAAAPASRPATKPASRPASRPAGVAAAERAAALARRRAADAAAAVEKARADGASRLEKSPEFKRAVADLDAKQKALEKARASGTPQEKLNASAAFTKARLLVEKLRADSVARDEALKKAIAAKAAADLEALRAEKHAAAEREANHPINIAIREGRFVKGMTEAQAGQVMARYPAFTSRKDVTEGADGEKTIRWTHNDVTTNEVLRDVTLVLRDGVVESVTEKERKKK